MLMRDELSTARLRLRRWQADDAVALQPILEANTEHLGPWIPARVAEPAAIPVLAQRLAGFADEFNANREWRYALFTLDGRLLGEAGLFPRSAEGRVPFAESDRVELGYWLRSDETGRGLVTEAARAVLELVATIPRFSQVEVRCDARNVSSAAVPKRLGFDLVSPSGAPEHECVEASGQMQLWVLALSRQSVPDA